MDRRPCSREKQLLSRGTVFGKANYQRVMPPVVARDRSESEYELDAIHASITNRPNSRQSKSRPKSSPGPFRPTKDSIK